MPPIRRVLLSMPGDQWLSSKQNALKWAIVKKIETLGYRSEVFFDPRGKGGLAAGEAWSPAKADMIARSCVGAAIIGMPRWTLGTQVTQKFPTEFNHYEGAIAYTLRLPMLCLVQDDLVRRVIFDNSYDGYVGVFPADADASWVKTNKFTVPFRIWQKELTWRRDIFLGYCGTSHTTAKQLKSFLKKDLGATVLDWKTDFKPGRTILNQIEEEATRCTAGIFLFTEDDQLTDAGGTEKAVPRDNVVFEAGYFINAKGKDRVLIIRESKAKMPADLGGDIYASLTSKSNIRSIKNTVRQFTRTL